MQRYSDDEIIAMLWARDERALEAFAARYRTLCMRMAENILGERESAEECLNDLYLRIWNSIPPERPRALKAYALRILRNLALHRLERARAQKRCATVVELDECAEAVAERETGEITALINGWLATVPERDAMIFVRRYFYSEAVGEIAARLGMRENQISKILYRLRRSLQAYLEKGATTV